MKFKYSGHRGNSDGSKDVSFKMGNIKHCYVIMPSDYPDSCVLTWIEKERIEDILTDKYNHDIQYDIDNNIQMGLCVTLSNFRFNFNSYDSHIEVYSAGYTQTEWGFLKDIDGLIDLYSENIQNKIKSTIKEVYDIDVKSIRLNHYYSDGNGITIQNIKQYARENRLEQLLGSI